MTLTVNLEQILFIIGAAVFGGSCIVGPLIILAYFKANYRRVDAPMEKAWYGD